MSVETRVCQHKGPNGVPFVFSLRTLKLFGETGLVNNQFGYFFLAAHSGREVFVFRFFPGQVAHFRQQTHKVLPQGAEPAARNRPWEFWLEAGSPETGAALPGAHGVCVWFRGCDFFFFPGPPAVPFYRFFLGEGSPTKIDYRKMGTLILTSLLDWRT